MAAAFEAVAMQNHPRKVERTRRTPSRRETTISWAIIGVLAIIAVGVFTKQFHYKPEILTPGQADVPGIVKGTPTSRPLSDFSDLLPTTMTPMNALETFDPDNLSDKINGKAEFYLSAGFVGLRCQRFALKADAKAWMEVYVYDMGTLRQAFAVFSLQRREDGMPSNLTTFSYRTQNTLFFVHGRYYVENIASMASETMMASMQFLGNGFVRKTPVSQKEIGELTLFPKDHLQEGTLTLSISNVFGFQGMKNVFTARYLLNGEELTAFLTPTANLQKAEILMEAYQSFLVTNGGSSVPLQIDLESAVLVKIFDTFELIFRRGLYVAGVHEAETQQGAERLAVMIAQNLSSYDE
jgi:hypothetical protein